MKIKSTFCGKLISVLIKTKMGWESLSGQIHASQVQNLTLTTRHPCLLLGEVLVTSKYHCLRPHITRNCPRKKKKTEWIIPGLTMLPKDL